MMLKSMPRITRLFIGITNGCHFVANTFVLEAPTYGMKSVKRWTTHLVDYLMKEIQPVDKWKDATMVKMLLPLRKKGLPLEWNA